MGTCCCYGDRRSLVSFLFILFLLYFLLEYRIGIYSLLAGCA